MVPVDDCSSRADHRPHSFLETDLVTDPDGCPRDCVLVGD